jgi:hypothetical protein
MQPTSPLRQKDEGDTTRCVQLNAIDGTSANIPLTCLAGASRSRVRVLGIIRLLAEQYEHSGAEQYECSGMALPSTRT